jgi:hypothetical protein
LLSYSDQIRQNELRYQGNLRGWKATQISQSQLLALPAEEFEWHKAMNPHFKAAFEGRDPETLKWKWVAQLVPTKTFAAVTQNNVTEYLPCFTHPSEKGFVVTLDGKNYRPKFAFKNVQFVNEIPEDGKPKSFLDAQVAAKERAHETLAAAQDVKRAQQTGITTTNTPIGKMMDAAKSEWVASKTSR